MRREAVPVMLRIPENKSDYDTVVAVWTGPLPDQPEAAEPLENGVRVKLAAQTDAVPTGIYDLKLEDSNPANARIRSAEWEKGVEIRSGMPPLALPRSVAGEYWGMVSRDDSFGYFMMLKIGEKLSSLTMQRVAISRINKVFKPENMHPLIGDLWQVTESASLEKPGVLHFSCPIFSVRTDWTILFDRDGNIVIRPAISPDNKDVKKLQSYLDRHLKDSAIDVLKLGQEAAAKIYDAADVNALVANRNYMRLRRFRDIKDDLRMTAEARLLRAIDLWEKEVNSLGPTSPGLRLYPLEPLYKQELPNHDWNITPVKPQND